MSTMLIKNNNNIVYKKIQLPKNFQNYSDFIAFSVFVSHLFRLHMQKI